MAVIKLKRGNQGEREGQCLDTGVWTASQYTPSAGVREAAQGRAGPGARSGDPGGYERFSRDFSLVITGGSKGQATSKAG